MAVITFDRVDVIFGRRVKEALALLDAGADKDRIFEETGQVVGVQDASLQVEAGEIFVLMGLSGSGKSTLLRCVNGPQPGHARPRADRRRRQASRRHRLRS